MTNHYPIQPSTDHETFSAADAPISSPAQFVRWFREVAPHIHNIRGKTFVIGFGGDLIKAGRLHALVNDLSLLNSLGVRLVLVHGSRPQSNEQMEIKGLTPIFNKKPHPIDEQAFECAKEAAGEIRLDIEAAFSRGLPNTPMSNSHILVVSGNFITAKPQGIIDGIDYQYMGVVRKVDVEAINRALGPNSIVLLSPIGFSPTGDAFNVGMEEVATSVAKAIKADRLVFLTPPNILLRDEQNEIITEIPRPEAEKLLNDITDEEAKIFLKYASDAVKNGVKRAHFIPFEIDGGLLLEHFTHDGVGTMVVEDKLDDLRPAAFKDIGAILQLIEPLEANGTLVPRGRSVIERDLKYFTVLEHDGVVYGCVSLIPYPESDMAEMACLIINPEWQGHGEGELLLHHIEHKARALGIKKLFVLTTQTSHWFVKRGFVKGTISDLPKPKQAVYNHSRNSLIFIKQLMKEIS
ncbi:amino-acid N-acetyltransferase [Basilea psittacipulmonis]|uniref:Amino-acid acetyltransferase n=1 Tax=Basilea psittacipulmonis DSM 24701 TaxID=1072685 RepID=A0A077DF88_9BURK|nr:amino-acid N-acetyltransferase [Basilea psittacipulmonis]AIL32781.1 amino acid acetyltransferase [Basilea psittacipulmonis DSM 24701]